MSKMHAVSVGLTVCLLALVLLCVNTRTVKSHCDTMNGPVVQDAREALARGDVTPVLKWVAPEFEGEVRNAFAATLSVRKQGGAAAELADRSFFETVVRIHRAGEGAPYTGLKDEPVDPVIAMAEEALGTGSPDDMIQKLKTHMETVVREKFTAVSETAKKKDSSVEEGRKYVAAYVAYMHHLEALHAAIVGGGAHAHDAAPATPDHEHAE